MDATTWDVPSAGARFGLSAGGPASRTTTETATMTTPSVAGQNASRIWHPDNPLLWVAGFAAATFGLMAVSTSVRVGPAKLSASVGK